MITLRQLPASLRAPFQLANASPWRGTLLIGLVGCCLIGLGWTLGTWYCEYQRARDLELTRQVVDLGSRCITTLGEVVPGAFVLARQERPVVLSTRVRDSLRVARWSSP